MHQNRDLVRRVGYNFTFTLTLSNTSTIMEAERLNAISHRITDLTEREAALRGYL